MKQRALQDAPFDEQRQRLRGLHGKYTICRWCGGELSGRRSAWCSDACRDEFYIRSMPSWARGCVKRRDKGVCALCGVDTLRLERFWEDARHQLFKLDRERHFPSGGLFTAWRRMFRASLGDDPGVRSTGYWDMDHIKPVVQGGGGCGLDNLRTLCIPCHKKETAKLAGERARAKQPQQELF